MDVTKFGKKPKLGDKICHLVQTLKSTSIENLLIKCCYISDN